MIRIFRTEKSNDSHANSIIIIIIAFISSQKRFTKTVRVFIILRIYIFSQQLFYLGFFTCKDRQNIPTPLCNARWIRERTLPTTPRGVYILRTGEKKNISRIVIPSLRLINVHENKSWKWKRKTLFIIFFLFCFVFSFSENRLNMRAICSLGFIDSTTS